jgi:hypothetical protein
MMASGDGVTMWELTFEFPHDAERDRARQAGPQHEIELRCSKVARDKWSRACAGDQSGRSADTTHELDGMTILPSDT